MAGDRLIYNDPVVRTQSDQWIRAVFCDRQNLSGGVAAMRLTSDLWVKALLRRVFQEGGFAAIERSGASEAGVIYVRVRRRDGLETLLGPAPQSFFDTQKPSDRKFEPRIVAGEEREIDALLAREAGFDPDFWVVEIETDSPETYLEITPAA